MSDLVQQMREKARGLLDAPFWNACADELAIARASQVGPIQVYIDQLKADRDRLAGELAKYRECVKSPGSAMEWIAVMQAELSAARADAERYRWLRASNENLDEAIFVTMGDYSMEWRDGADALIDAARAAPSAGGEQS